MKKAYDNKNNLFVTIVSVSGGWTTVMSGSGTQYKLRNSMLEPVSTDHAHKADHATKSLTRLEADPTVIDDDFDIAPKTTRRILTAEFNLDDYAKVKSASGRNSLDCGDKVARLLRGKTLDEVYALAAEKLITSEQELRAKYAHLNTGMQRMNLSNRMRAI